MLVFLFEAKSKLYVHASIHTKHKVATIKDHSMKKTSVEQRLETRIKVIK